MKFNKLAIVVAISNTLVACGGGDSGNSPNISESSVEILNTEVIDLSMFKQRTLLFRSGLVKDLDNDGRNEFIVTITGYPDQPKIPIFIFGDKNNKINLTADFFNGSVPSVKHSPYIFYEDVTNDGKKDLIFADAGLDSPPWTGAKVQLAIGQDNKFYNADSLLAETSNRNYAIAVGDFLNNRSKQILIQDYSNGSGNGKLLRWANGTIVYETNPIQNYQEFSSSSMFVDDFDRDGYDDLLVGGSWIGKVNTIIYGSNKGITGETTSVLPPGPFKEEGYKSCCWKPIQGAEVKSLSLDVNQDGFPDIISTGIEAFWSGPTTKTVTYKNNYFFVTTNLNGKEFKLNQIIDLKDNFYQTMIPMDLNQDGKMDIIAYYHSTTGNLTGTTFFINQQNGQFKEYDASTIFPELVYEQVIGHLAPTTFDQKHLTMTQVVTRFGQQHMTVRTVKFNQNRFVNLK
jgi:hypothetical protein